MRKTILHILGTVGLMVMTATSLQILTGLEPDQCKREGLFGFVVFGGAGVFFGPALYRHCIDQRK